MGCVGSKQRPFRRKSTLLSEKRSSRFDSSRLDEWIQPQVVFDRSSSRRDAKDSKLIESEMLSSNRYYCDHQVEKIHDQELRKASSPVVKPDLEIGPKGIEPKLDRWNSIDSKVRLIEFEKLSSKRLSDHHQIDKEPEVQAVVPRELSKKQSVAAAPKDTELKQLVSAGWPTWLVSVAGEALVDWAPRRASTFEKLEKIGQGTYSSVYRARDLTHNKIVALKKVRFDLNDIESVKFMAREIIVMRRLDHPNVLKLEGLITAPVSSSLYLVFDYMDHDLLGLSSLPGVEFTEPQVKCYMRQLLSGLEHCHSRGVLHRDIKGSNLLIDGNGVLKIADFGLATFFDPKAKTVALTSHVVTLWYRPPELLLGASHYGVGVDLWSTGCILGELYAGKPILPGKTEVEQLHKIFKLCGSPTESYWRKHNLPSSAGFRTAIPYRRKLSEMYKDFPESVLLLLETLLSIDPDHRSSASSALESEYFKTKPLACDPSCLPKYPPSKEIDAKLRDDEEKKQRPEKQERQDSQGRRSHERKAIPPIRANHSLSMSMDKPYLDLKSRNESFKSFKEERTSHVPAPDYPNMQTRNNQSGERVSYSGPLMINRNVAKSTMYVKENAPPPRYPPSRVNPRVLSGSVSSKALLDQCNDNVEVSKEETETTPSITFSRSRNLSFPSTFGPSCLPLWPLLMGSAAEVNEPTTAGTEKLHHPVNLEEEEEEQVVELERKTSPFLPHGKRPDSADGSTITTNNSSSSSFSEGIPDPRNGEGEHIGIENLEVPESPVVGFHEEHHDGNVFFDGEEGSKSHESNTADNLSAEKKERVSENGSTSEDNKGPSREIEEVQDTDLPEEVVVQRTGDVIEEEEVDIDDVEDYNVEKVLDNQETHDLFCPNCHSCITKRVVLKKRKRKISHAVPEDPKRVRGPDRIDPILRSEDNEPSPVGGDSSTPESFFYKCLSCFSIFIPKGVDSKPVVPSESVERLNTQPKPQEEATGHSNWFGSMFGSKKKEPPVQQGGAMPSIPEASLPRDNPSVLGEETAGSTANIPSKAPALVQEGPVPSIQDVSEISVSLDNKPVDDTPLIQVANSNDTGKGVNSGATVENGQQFLVPSADEEQTQQKIDRDGATSAADENHSPDKGRLSPIQPSRDMNISNIVTSGPDGVRVETIFHTEGVSHLFEGTEPRKPDFGLAKVTGVMESGDGAPIRGIDIPPLPLSSLEEGTLTEPLVGPAVAGPVVEGRKVEILKSIVYGGLIEAITSLGVISSAAGSGASTLNILVLGLANLFGGLILIIHNLQELREEEPITTEDNQTNVQEEGRYKRLLGRRENFTLHVTVAIISFIIMGLLPPIVYYFSFSKTHNRDYKVASVFGASLLCIVLLALAKAHVRSPRGSHLKSVLKYAMIAVSVSGISYVVGNFVDQLLEKYGWSDGSETPAAEMMLSLLGRKAGSFGYSSSY